ncbi:MAG: hypothetical protein AB9836_03540 [Aminipila sp.]
MKKGIKLYNIIFPVWMLLIFPPTWIVILPANFIIDSLVLLIALKFIIKNTDIKKNYKKTILKVWSLGFAADIVGTLTLFIVETGFSNMGNDVINHLEAIYWNPLDNPYAFLYVCFAIAISTILIFIFNYKISFKNVDLNKIENIKVSLTLAILTAPYTFLIPTEMFYN